MATSTNAHNRSNRAGARSSGAKKRQPYTEQDAADAMTRCYSPMSGVVYHVESYDASGLMADQTVALSDDDFSKEIVIPLARIASSCAEVKRTCQRHHDADHPMGRDCMLEDTSRLGAWTPGEERSPSHDAPPNRVARSTAQPCPECLSIVYGVLFGFQDGDRYVKGVIPVLNRLGDRSPGTRQSLAELRTTINNVAIDQHRARQVSAGLPAKPTASISGLHLADLATERIVTAYFTIRLATGCSHREGIENAALDLMGRQPEVTIEDARSTVSAAIAQARREVGEERWRSTITDAFVTRSAARPVSPDQCLDAEEGSTRSGYDLVDSLDAPLPSTEPVKNPTAGARSRNSSHAADKELRTMFLEELRSALGDPANNGRSDLEVAICVMEALAEESSTADLMRGPLQERYSGERAGETVRELLRTSPEALATLRALVKESRREVGAHGSPVGPRDERAAFGRTRPLVDGRGDCTHPSSRK